MVILKLHEEQAASAVAYALRGKQIKTYVVLWREDRAAVDLAIALSDSKLLYRSYPGVLLALILGGAISGVIACQGLIGIWSWADSLPDQHRPQFVTPIMD